MIKQIIYIILLIFCFCTLTAYGVDLSSCADDLQSLRSAADSASDAAEEADSARQEFESKKNELEDCLNDPDTYDLMQDHCESLHWDYDSAKSDYESALSSLESELDTVTSRFRNLEWSCGIQFHPRKHIKPKGSLNTSICKTMLSIKGTLTTEQLLHLCMKYMSEQECKQCLQIK